MITCEIRYNNSMNSSSVESCFLSFNISKWIEHENFEFNTIYSKDGGTKSQNKRILSAVYCLLTTRDRRGSTSSQKSFAVKLAILLLSGEILVSY